MSSLHFNADPGDLVSVELVLASLMYYSDSAKPMLDADIRGWISGYEVLTYPPLPG